MSNNISKNRSFILPEESVVEFLSINHEISAQMSLTSIGFIYNQINKKFGQDADDDFDLDWFEEGVPCEFIRHEYSSKSWIDGRLRIKLAFFPDRDILEKSTLNEPNDCGWITSLSDDVFRLDAAFLQLPRGHIFHIRKNLFSNKELINCLRVNLSLDDINSYRYAWLDYGIPCRVLLDGTSLNGWNSGRIYLKIEVKPDSEKVDSEVESSLDDIRNAIEVNSVNMTNT